MIHIGEELDIQTEESMNEDSLQPDDNSLSYFCQFVDDYTCHSVEPMSIAAVCENQAAEIRITRQDLDLETIYMLIETMLTAIGHLEKKWLDEQIQRAGQLQRAKPLQSGDLERRQAKNWLKHLYQTWTRWIQNQLVRDKHITVVDPKM